MIFWLSGSDSMSCRMKGNVFILGYMNSREKEKN